MTVRQAHLASETLTGISGLPDPPTTSGQTIVPLLNLISLFSAGSKTNDFRRTDKRTSAKEIK
jgi:hypothetical protein